jgi:alcohol dehydrogenase class IV
VSCVLPRLVAVLSEPSCTQPLSDMYGVGNVRASRLPLVQVPTTAGTGSEVTPISIITTGVAEKKGVVSPQLLPDLAMLDGDLLTSLPPHVAAATGIDSMVHAIEVPYPHLDRDRDPDSDPDPASVRWPMRWSLRTLAHMVEPLRSRSHTPTLVEPQPPRRPPPPLSTIPPLVRPAPRLRQAYTSVPKKNMLSDLLAREALTLLGGNIRAICHPDAVGVRTEELASARSAMMLGSCYAGMAFANAPVAAVHALAYPLGSHYHVPHGLSNSLVLPHVLDFNAVDPTALEQCGAIPTLNTPTALAAAALAATAPADLVCTP